MTLDDARARALEQMDAIARRAADERAELDARARETTDLRARLVASAWRRRALGREAHVGADAGAGADSDPANDPLAAAKLRTAVGRTVAKLERLLLDVDRVDTNGDEEIRAARKRLVAQLQGLIETAELGLVRAKRLMRFQEHLARVAPRRPDATREELRRERDAMDQALDDVMSDEPERDAVDAGGVQVEERVHARTPMDVVEEVASSASASASAPTSGPTPAPSSGSRTPSSESSEEGGAGGRSEAEDEIEAETATEAETDDRDSRPRERTRRASASPARRPAASREPTYEDQAQAQAQAQAHAHAHAHAHARARRGAPAHDDEREPHAEVTEFPHRAVITVRDALVRRAVVTAKPDGTLTIAVPGRVPLKYSVDPNRFNLQRAVKEVDGDELYVVLPRRDPSPRLRQHPVRAVEAAPAFDPFAAAFGVGAPLAAGGAGGFRYPLRYPMF